LLDDKNEGETLIIQKSKMLHRIGIVKSCKIRQRNVMQ